MCVKVAGGVCVCVCVCRGVINLFVFCLVVVVVCGGGSRKKKSGKTGEGGGHKNFGVSN